MNLNILKKNRKKGFTLIEVLITSMIGLIVMAGISNYIPLATAIANEVNIETRALNANDILITTVMNDIRKGSWLKSDAIDNLKIYTAEFSENYPKIVYSTKGGDGSNKKLIKTIQNPENGDFISSSTVIEDLYKSLDIEFVVNKTKAEVSLTVEVEYKKNSLKTKELETTIYCRGYRLGGMEPSH